LLLNGLALGATALIIRYLRGSDRLAVGSFTMLYVAGLWSMTAVDLYGPYHFFRLHALCETLVFASIVHMALVFPRTAPLLRGRPGILAGLYLLAGLLAVVNQVGLYSPAPYRATHLLATSAIGVSLAVLIAMQFWWYLNAPSFDVRQRVKILAFGAALSLSAPALLALGSTVTGGQTPQNAMTFTSLFYPIAIGYAVLRHNVLEVDEFVRRTLNYVLLTAMVTLAYVGAIRLFDLSVSASSGTEAQTLGFAVTVLLVVLLLPLRDRVQSVIDRVFFRTAYDFRRIVETVSARLASASDLDFISAEITHAICQTLHPDRFTLYVRRSEKDLYVPYPAAPGLESLAFDQLRALRSQTEPVDLPQGGLLVPCRADGELVGVLLLARPRSGRIYGADDRRLLQTLANQSAVAIENALAVEQLRDLNRDLEAKVEERTRELREAHAQLVQREKMASLGQFVAGIAHEINNPLNFIQGNLYCLREYVGVLQESIDAYAGLLDPEDTASRRAVEEIRERLDLDTVLTDMGSAFEGCMEGVERSTSLVRDLRTFSRLDEPERMPSDLHAGLDSTLNLLRSKLNGLEVEKDYSGIPAVECFAGQVNQVFVNLIANAAEATGTGGRVRISTRLVDDDHVCVEVQDDGPGIPSEQLDRIFDPFFTTKPVGKGTGLGLSISYGIVERHGGAIRVTSEPGQGTSFQVVLPIHAPTEAGQTAAHDHAQTGEQSDGA
jgi:signal transduction histidine kinase